MFDVITIGSATVDVFAKTAKKDSDLITINHNNQKEEFLAYQLGTKILITDLQFQIGGGGTNTAVSFARMGLKTGYLMRLGNDDNGDKVLKLLEEEGIEFLGMRGTMMSGYSVILDSIANDRTILTYKGSNNNLMFNEIDLDRIDTKWIYVSSLMGKSFETLKKIVPWARKKGIKIAFNPSSYQAEMGHVKLKTVLKNLEVLVLNFEESKKLAGVKDCSEVKDILKTLYKLGPKLVVVTRGDRGAHCYDGKSCYYLKPRKVRILETTGAGDAFSSGFIAALIKTNDVKYALKIGITNAESVIKHYGAKNILLDWNTAEKNLKKHPHKVQKIKLE